MENRAYIPDEAYQSYIQPMEAFDELEQRRVARSEVDRMVPTGRKVVQYELDFDREQARDLLASRGQEGYESRLENFKSFTEMQLVTALGERFNKGLSRYSYINREGVLFGEHSEEPFLDVLERGRSYREIHGNPIDHAREKAEVEGFNKIQDVLGDEETPAGTILLSISPPGEKGSIYTHNFYDGFRKKENGDVEVVRFSNALSAAETVEKLRELSPDISVPDELNDVNLLSNPILLQPDVTQQMTLDSIHAHLHMDHAVMSEEDFAVVRNMCAFLIVSYVNALLDNPDDFDTHARMYNALLNKADEVADALQREPESISFMQSSSEMTEEQIYYLGNQEVRAVDTGCGFSGGADMSTPSGESALGQYSVAMFGMEDRYGGLTFKCPHCNYENTRPYGKLIEKCGDGQVGGCKKSVRC